ncbi:MAG TPA: chromate resistance protein ChrB domain-containing protein [Rudaea sp.]|nr:chromate resistance protein ChrB domain-containing protein [Rudaea sp.]
MSNVPWLLLIGSIAGENKTARQRIWRALKASGAGTLRDGVYVLPNSEAARASFEEQAQDIVSTGGTAHVLTIEAEGAEQEQRFKAMFDRRDSYAALVREIDRIKTSIAKLDEAAARRELVAVRRESAALMAIDFFPGASRRQVEHALLDLEAAFTARFSPDEPHAAKGHVPRRERSRYKGRTWATRERPWVDRIASAWLIRRFIDPKAKIVWLKRPKDCPKHALGFDFDGAEFTHIGARVTFEVLAASFGLEQDPAIARLGRLVHCLDIGGVPVPEAPGFAAILAGARMQQPNDDKLLRSMSGVLDALYTSYRDPNGGET